MAGRILIVTLAAVTGCGRLGFEAGSLDGNPRDTEMPDVALCPVVDEHFDSTLGSTWATYYSGGGSAPTVTNGALVLDVPTTVSTSSVGMLTIDLRDAVITVTARNYTFEYGSQVYLEITAPNRYFAINALPDIASQGFIVARIQTTAGFDDVSLPMPKVAAMRLRIATAPVSGGTLVVWSYATSETTPFIEARRQTVTDSFSAADFGAAYQVWSPAAADPPPVEIDDFQLAHPCM